MAKLTEYENLLSKSYDEAIEVLHQKYGEAKKDYFNKESYNNFLEGRNCKPRRPKNTGTPKGLYCHHICETKYTNLSNLKTIKREKHPFYLQKKGRLVYCDLFEHAILHVLIAEETVFEYGFLGYKNLILRNIEKWYIKEEKPEGDKATQWEKDCYKKAYLKPEEASFIVCLMFKVLEEKFCKHLKEKIDRYKYVENSIAQGYLFRKIKP